MSSNGRQMETFAGLATARGLASGPVFLYHGEGEIVIPEYRVQPGEERAEVERLHQACVRTRRDLEGLISVLRDRTGRDEVKVFECHLLILEDPQLMATAERYILGERYNAAAATRHTADGARAQFERMNDPYFRERVRDLDDVERRLLTSLLGSSGEAMLELKSPAILVADDLTPSETVRLPREMVLGFAINSGSTTSHVALLARALGLPAVSGLGDITSRVGPGDMVLLDGTNGTVAVNPDLATLEEFRRLERRQLENSPLGADGVAAGIMADGGDVRLLANVHPGVPMAGIRELGARGIGLYRSEYLWLTREAEPTEEEQFVAYRDVAKFSSALGRDSSVVIRVLDIGGDKFVHGASAHEANPFLGNRSIRYLLSHSDVFLKQLRAILRSSAFGRVRLMYPMVSCVEELREANRLLEAAKASLDAENVAYDHGIEVGAMIEVPAAAINADAIAGFVSFFSIGTNDLVQYTMAADRGNEAVSHLYQPMNPAVQRLVRHTVESAARHGVEVSVCGESASDPVVGIFWAALGIRELSMSASYIPMMAALLRRLSRADLDEYAAFVAAVDSSASAAEIYDAARAWLRERIPGFDELTA